MSGRLDQPDLALLRYGWLFAGIIGALIYSPSIAYDFTYDDTHIVRDNIRIRDLGKPAAYLGTSYWDRPGMHKEYRPVVLFSYALNYAHAGEHAAPYHATNVLLHGAVCAAVWWLAAALFGSALLATLAALLFAVHPMHVESVAGIVGRAELLSSLFFILAMIAALKSARAMGMTRRWLLAGAASLAALLAYGTKENTATLLPALLLLAFLPGDSAAPPPALRDRVKRLIPALVACTIAFAVYMIARRAVLGGFLSALGQQSVFAFDNPLIRLAPPFRAIVATKLLSRYALMLVWPFNPSPDYSLGAIPIQIRLLDPDWLIGAVIAALLIWLLYRLRDRRAVLFGFAFFVVTFAITANIFFPIGTLMAERLLYLPSVGFCILAADLLLYALERARDPLARKLALAGAGVFAIWLIAISAQALRYQPMWKSNETLAGYMVERVPGSARAQMLAGQIASAKGDYDKAIEHLEQSVKIAPGIAQSLASLGAAYMQQGRTAEAKRVLEEAFSLEPNETIAIVNLARIYAREGNWDAAERLYPIAIQTQPRHYALRRDYGLLLEERGKAAEAIAQLEMLLPRDGMHDDEAVVFALARAHLQLGNRTQAVNYLKRTLRTNPNNARAEAMLNALSE